MLQRKSHIKISSCLRELQPLLLKQSEKFHSSINKRSRYFENNVHQDLFMFKGTTCHHVTGECLPCAPGLWGEGCKEKCKWVILLKKLQKVENRCHIHHHHHLWTLGEGCKENCKWVIAIIMMIMITIIVVIIITWAVVRGVQREVNGHLSPSWWSSHLSIGERTTRGSLIRSDMNVWKIL